MIGGGGGGGSGLFIVVRELYYYDWGAQGCSSFVSLLVYMGK